MSFLILIIANLIPVCFYMIKDVKENKSPVWQCIAMILLVIALYLDSINH